MIFTTYKTDRQLMYVWACWLQVVAAEQLRLEMAWPSSLEHQQLDAVWRGTELSHLYVCINVSFITGTAVYL